MISIIVFWRDPKVDSQKMWLKKSDPYFSGVTDSKAVKGSQNSMSGATTSIVVIVTGVATGLVSTVLLICLLVAYRSDQELNFFSVSF